MDINAIKNRLNQLQTTTSTKNSFWKPEPGKTQIRIVPYKFNKDNPFQELFFHYQFENKTMVSPVTYGRPDPINEFSTKLKSTGVKDDWIQGKRLEPKMRTYAPVVVRGQESEGVKFWGFGKTVYQELLSIIADPDYGDITDAINGRDITVEKMTPAEAGNQYGKTTIRVKPNMTPLTEDKEQLKSMIESQVDINTLYTEPTYDELKEVLDRYMNPESQEEETQEESTSEPVATTVSDAGDAFDELFSSK
jgi:hypothetical protein